MLILLFEVIFSLIAIILSVLSFRTFRAINRLGVGKTFWIPMFVSSALFVISSVFTILFESGISLWSQMIAATHISRIFALTWLVVAIFNYSRQIGRSLTEEFSLPEQIDTERLNFEASGEDNLEIESPTCEKVLLGKPTHVQTDPAIICKHRLGYLQTLPKDTSIPDECLNCDQIIECKHSLEKKQETLHTI
jgi:hypothetical protein